MLSDIRLLIILKLLFDKGIPARCIMTPKERQLEIKDDTKVSRADKEVVLTVGSYLNAKMVYGRRRVLIVLA